MAWEQAGETIHFSKGITEPALILSSDQETLTMHLRGEWDATYTIESSTDLRTWKPMQTASIWDSPRVLPLLDRGRREYFRL